jgi:hypothetical protein
MQKLNKKRSEIEINDLFLNKINYTFIFIFIFFIGKKKVQ